LGSFLNSRDIKNRMGGGVKTHSSIARHPEARVLIKLHKE
jgi:hypothetical protein